MGNKNDQEAFYKRLKGELAKSTQWPSLYMYKFIVPSDEQKILTIEKTFDNMGAVIDKKSSSNGNYTSISVKVTMEDPESVIAIYKEVGQVEGVISL
ncbi:DUF493 family protein [Robertkochia aurantiaca]|uniref:DUF493 family protein n=1 Tax=Robertkochia aurantiaca TaxID=2873700 RepID=UPI001CC9BD70|nr:DUF493 family protein [Robertkochia sp. 3YJGBD-33]